jgi:ectoine hydroxylase-related dioxygenase (phytanoyl-CoA dioxygenase family)
MFDKQNFLKKIEENGYCILENVLSNVFVEKAKKELESAIAYEVEYHGTEKYSDYGMVLLCAKYGGVFEEIFNFSLLTEPMEAVLGEGCILYAYTSSSMPPNSSNFSNRIHVDSPRFIPNYLTNFGAFIALSDINEDNGAMYFLPASHTTVDLPTEKYFYANAKRCVLKAGSVFFFNPRLWHAGGVNKTNQWRHAITMNICRSYIKQRLDIPRVLSNTDTSKWSEKAKQKLGFYTQTPASYEEYYVTPELRKYKQKYE